MKRKLLIFGMPALFVLAAFLFLGFSLTSAQRGQREAESAPVGSAFTYQGQLNDAGAPAAGNYDFEFGLYDAASIGNQIGMTLTQAIMVNDGLFTTALDFGSNVFNGEARYLEIAVKLSGGGGYTTLTPRQPLTAVPYASYADKVQPLKNVINVAKSGGDFDNVSDALASISDASENNPYLIKIAPGVYTETGGIDLKNWVDIEGSGNRTTFLQAGGGSTNPVTDGTAATLRAGNVWAEVRHLHIDSYTSNSYAVAIWTTGAANTTLRFTDVVAESAGGTVWNVGIFNSNSSPFFDTFWVYTLFGSGTSTYGVYNYDASAPTMNHGFVNVSGGTSSYGIYNQKSSPELNRVTMNASGATGANIGLFNDGASPVIVTHISASGLGGSTSYGIYNGIYNAVSSFALIIDSYVVGGTNSLFTQSSFARVSNSTLDGPVSTLNNCLDSHNGFGAALDTACQTISGGDAVTWDDVANIPAGFADGVDNVGGVDPANIVWVATSGGDYTSVSAALTAISDASASNPYLIKVAPGIYTEAVTLKSYVDIEGSGEGVTILRGLGGASYVGTMNATGIIPAEVRFLTIESITSAAVGIGIKTDNTDASLKFTHISVIASGGTSDSYGIYNYNGSPTLSDVTLTATGAANARGIFNQNGSSPTLFNVSVTASGGTNNAGVFNITDASPLMTNVIANASGTGSNYGVKNETNSSPAMTNVTTSASGGLFAYGVDNEDSSPAMTNVIANASGASSQNYGVHNIVNSSPAMTNVTASASGGSTSYGVLNDSSSPVMNNVITIGSGGSAQNYGVRNDASSSPIMNNVTATGSGGSAFDVGVYNIGNSQSTIRDSQLTGTKWSITNQPGSSAKIANTMLAGPIGNTAYTCFNTYNASFAAVICP